MAGTTRKSTKKSEEKAKPAAEETEVLSPLPGMDIDASGADKKQSEKAGGDDGVPATDDTTGTDDADANAEQTPDAPQDDMQDQTGAEDTVEDEDGNGEPAIYAPNLFVVMYEGDEPYEMREALRRPYPKLKNGDVVITDRKTAKWLTRKGMPFSIVEDILTIRKNAEVKKTTFFDALKKVFG